MPNHELELLFLQFRDDGDMRALARLFDAAAPKLLPVAVHLAARRDEADDLLQATFLTAIERAESYERGRAVLPWLLGILALHARKLRQKQGRILDLERVRQPSENDPELVAASAEVRQAVEAACRTLPAAYATIVQRHLVEGLEPLELASEMGLSNGAARVRLHRGLKLLRRALPVAFSSGSYAATSTRGVAAIREAVLERASMLTGSPIPAAGFAPLGLLLTFLLPFAIAVPAWLAWHGRGQTAPEESVLAAGSSSSATSTALAGAQPAPMEIDRAEAVNSAESATSVHEFNAHSTSGATVRGRLVLAGGAPAAGASVQLTGWAGNDERAHEFGLPVDWHDPAIQSAGADGRFEFSLDPPRAYCFRMKAEHASAAMASWFWYEIAPTGTIDLGDIPLEASATIVAHIVDANSNPLAAGWTIDVEAPAPKSTQGRVATSIRTKWVEGSNEFVIEHVPARRVTIGGSTDTAGKIQPIVAELVAGQTRQIELRYTGPDLGRRITVTTSTRPFNWYDDGSYEIRATRPGAAPIAAHYNQAGLMAYLIDGCDPGSYEVTVSDPHFLPWSKSNVQPGQLVRVKLIGNAALQLHLTDGQGAPYTGPYTLRGNFFTSNAAGSSQSSPFVLVDPSQGLPANQRIDGMIPANYALTLEAPGIPPQAISVVGLAANEVRDIACTLGAGIGLSGKVVGFDGTTPVIGADVQLTRGDRAGHTGPAGSQMVDHHGMVPRIDKRMETDAQGQFTFSGLNVGHWTVRAGGKYLSVDRTVDCGANSEPLVLQLPPSGSLSGHLLVPPGVSLSDSELWIWLADENAPSGLSMKHDELQPDGSFHYGPLPLGEARLSLMVKGGGGAGTIYSTVIVDGVATQAEIDLSDRYPGRVKVHVVIDDTSASGGAVHWTIDGPAPIHGGNDGGSRVVDLDGVSKLDAMKPGNIRIRYESKDMTWGWQVPQPIAITAGQEIPYELVLHTTARDLRCLDAVNGAVLANVEIEWRTALGNDEPVVAKAHTDAQGLLHLRMPDQQVELRCVGDSGAFSALAYGAGTGPLNVALRRAP